LQQAGIAALCPSAVFELSAPVTISNQRQQIFTEGLPTDETRAVLRVAAASVTTAVLMRDFNGVVLRNVIVDGNRGGLGARSGDALIYAGGYSNGQVIRDNKIMNTRSWSSLQLIQGFSASQPCTGALVEDNEIGPAGTSDDMQWADGISLACTQSTVRGNTITDATDGAIVVFGAVGSVIERNTIRARTRTLLGGINMVDVGLYGGNYAGTVVKDNIIEASGAVIRIGLAMGPRVWGCLPAGAAEDTVTGGTVLDNTLRGTRMQYGYAADGVTDWTVTGNVDNATHSGHPSVDCGGRLAARPAGFLYTPARAKGVFQPEFVNGQLDLALWAIVSPRPGT
jgi:Right handed beta helix region